MNIAKIKKQKINLTHCYFGFLLYFIHLIWWITAVFANTYYLKNLTLTLGVFVLFVNVITGIQAFYQYKSKVSRSFTEFVTINLSWQIIITILLENFCWENGSTIKEKMFLLISGIFLVNIATDLVRISKLNISFFAKHYLGKDALIVNQKLVRSWDITDKVFLLIGNISLFFFGFYCFVRIWNDQSLWQIYSDQYYVFW